VNEFQRKYSNEIQQILAKYPENQARSAVMPLLHLVQREEGYVTKQALTEIGETLNITATEVASIVGFYTLYHDAPGGRYRLQVCTDLPCALRGADEFLQQLCENLGIRVGETSADGVFTIEEVTCLAGCHRAPMLQVQGDGKITYHENQTVDATLALVAELRKHASKNKEAAHD
jgi:NADH-quinone oxidoreductase subunit E